MTGKTLVFVFVKLGLMLIFNCQQSTFPEIPQKTLGDYDNQYRMIVKEYPQLSMINSDGTNKTEILNYEGFYLQEATVNKDFSKVAFAGRFNDPEMEIYIMNIDGTDLRKVSTHPNDRGNLSPRFLPNEDALIYHAYDVLRKTNFDGSVNEQISPDSTSVSGQSSSVANDKIAFVASKVIDGVLMNVLGIMNADGSDFYYHSDEENYFMSLISPDGRKICFVNNNEIYVMNIDGTNKINLSNHSARDVFPGWSPDGSKIHFESDRDGQHDLYIIDSNGENLRKVLNLPTQTPFLPSWSPDMSRMAYIGVKSGESEVRNGIYIIDIETGNRMKLTTGIEIPVWLNLLQ